jgi:hypothetical protein
MGRDGNYRKAARACSERPSSKWFTATSMCAPPSTASRMPAARRCPSTAAVWHRLASSASLRIRAAASCTGVGVGLGCVLGFVFVCVCLCVCLCACACACVRGRHGVVVGGAWGEG